MQDMDKDIRNGLRKKTNPLASIKCYITYIQDLPNGTGKIYSDDYTIMVTDVI